MAATSAAVGGVTVAAPADAQVCVWLTCVS